MKTKFIFKNYSFMLTLSMMLFLSSAFAQTRFEVTAPGNISGLYDISAAGFGGELPGCVDMTPISGELIIVDDGTDPATDGCEPIQNDLTGKIALIDRGACEFGVKVLNAENAGAIMVIVCNNQQTDIFAMGAGAVGDQVTIPSLMISLDDCTTIRAEVPGATVEVYWDPIIPSDDVVLWDGGQFDGGLGDWTTNAVSPDTAFWTWTPDGKSDNGNIVYSPTVCNGAAIFDANVYNAAASGGSPPYPQFAGELISPVIDCSTFDYVSLKFYTHNLRLNGNTTFAVSTDGGTTWGAETTITTENVFTATETILVGTEIKRYLISEFAGEPNCRIRFTFNGDFYFFILDDVQLIEPERNNLAVMDNFYAIAPLTMTPSSQVEPFSFLADVANLGAVEQPNVNLNVSIVDETTSAVVFDEDLSYGNIPADSLVENEPFTAYFTPDGTITSYRGTYEVSSDSVDFDPSDNFRYFNFETTDSTFATESGATTTIRPADAGWEGDNEPHSWAFGNYYYVKNGDDWWANTVTFAIGAPADDVIGRLITIYLYRWDDDTNEDGAMDPDERTPVGFNVYEITGDESIDTLITVPLSNFPYGDPGPIDLDSEQAYAVMIEYSTNDEVNFFIAASDINYAAMTFRSELDGIPEGNGRYAYMLGVNGDLSSEPYTSAGFNNPVAPVARLNITDGTIGFNDPLGPENTVEVSPNPANNTINVNIDLVETQEKATVRIFDINGRIMLDQPYQNMKNETLEYNVSNFASGAYFLRFITENGVRVERFVVQH